MDLGQAINRILALAGLRIVKSSTVPGLLSEVSSLRASNGKQAEEIAELASRMTDANSQVQQLQADLHDTKDDLDRISRAYGRSYSHIMHLETRLQQIGSRANKKADLLIVVTTISQIVQLKAFVSTAPISELFSFTVVAYFGLEGTSLVEFCAENGIALLDHNCQVVAPNPELETLLAGRPELPYFGSSVSLSRFEEEDQRLLEQTSKLLAELHWQNRIGLQAQGVMQRIRPSALVLFEDNAGYHTGAWVAVAHRNDVPAIVLPYAIIDQGDAAEAYYNEPVYWADNETLNRFVNSALPHWVLSYRERRLLRRPAVGAIASELLGFAQPQPWVWNSTRADVLAVENEAMREIYLAQGISSNLIEVTGSIADDLLCKARDNAAATRRALGFDPERPVLVCGFPPNQLTVNRPDPEFASFADIVARWLGEFDKLENWQVVIKPHPAMRADDLALLRSFRYPVTDLDTVSLIPICDLFNTSVSSTIRWAIACGKPVLNYDVYRYRYQDFVDEPAVLTVHDFADFSGQLVRLTADSEARGELTRRAEASSARWGMLDGRSTQRITDLLCRLADRTQARAKIDA